MTPLQKTLAHHTNRFVYRILKALERASLSEIQALDIEPAARLGRVRLGSAPQGKNKKPRLP